MRLFSVHRKYFKMSPNSLAPYMAGVLLAVLVSSSVTVAEPQFTSAGFIDTDQDLLAMPSDVRPAVRRRGRTGPITQYAFDSVPLESQNGAEQQGAQVVVAPPQQPDHTQMSAGTAIYVSDQAQSEQQLQQHQPDQLQEQQQLQQGHEQSASGFPHITHIDGHGHHGFHGVPVPAAVPVALGHPTTVFVPDDHHAVPLHPHGLFDVYHDIMHSPHKAVDYVINGLTKFAVPQDHYMNVASFVGIYLFMSYLMYATEDVAQLTCEITGGNKRGPQKEWAYHAGRRFVPALPVDQKLQMKFTELFKGVHLEDDGGSSSEENSGEISQMNELAPKGTFFYSLSPNNILAWTQLQRLFVAQRTPADVYDLAKDLLHKQRVHPKIWYLGLMAAAMERPDMTGFTLVHPLDAVPDWFIPGHLIKDEFDRYRALTLARQGDRAKSGRVKRGVFSSRGNSTYVPKIKIKPFKFISGNKTTTARPIPSTDRYFDSGEMSGEDVGLDGSPIKKRSKKGEDEIDDEFEAPTKLEKNLLRQGGGGGGGGGGGSGGGKHHKRHHGKGKGKGHGHGHRHHKKGKGKGHKKKDKCIIVDGRVGRDNGIENKLWYWREDIMLNQHHWYWHQVFPLNATRHPERRAELFFFMHRAFLARYNAERLSNGLPLTHLMDFQPGGIIHDGYNSHMADLSSGQWWAPRPPKLPLTDVLHQDDIVFARDILMPDVMAVYHRLLKAAKTGKMISPNGKFLKIHHSMGIEPFANTIEATSISANPLYYDYFGIHNTGHLLLAYAADPYWKLKLPPGPMADQAMSMRDPSFYPYHVVIDNLFEKFKALLPPYKVIGGEFPLLWRGVEVHHIEVVSKGHNTINHLRTFWTDRKFDLAPGVDRTVEIAEEEHAKVCAVHLAHEPFLFKIVVHRKPCALTKSGKGTVRIFMAPRFDEKGRRIHFRDQRRMMFQLDSFPVKLRVGKNIITRRSHDSSLTKPWTRSIKEMELMGQDPSGAADFCGCGWPQHLYIPKGSHDGMLFDLFVMITNWDEDRVKDSPKDLQFPEPCNSPHIFCSHPRRRYPDARPMGYPFDRPTCKVPIPCHPGHNFGSMVCRAFNLVFIKPVEVLEQFVAKAPNMRSTVFTIKHVDHFVGGHHDHHHH